MCSAVAEMSVAVVKEQEECRAQTKPMCSLKEAASVAKPSPGLVLCAIPMVLCALLGSYVPPLVSCGPSSFQLHDCTRGFGMHK